MKRCLLLLLCCLPVLSAPAEVPSLDYEAKALAGLVGDGRSLVRTMPAEFRTVRGRRFEGRLTFADAADTLFVSSFFPGGVEYRSAGGRRILYGSAPRLGFVVAAETPADETPVLRDGSAAALHRRTVRQGGRRTTLYSERAAAATTLDELKEELYRPYADGLTICTPDPTLDLAVQFSQYLLDLGYDGDFMLCELFRWLDVWARDLGSGLLPGALISGRVEAARRTLEYDLRRYARMSPADCKNSNDPSQGGTAEGVGWTLRSIWRSYLCSGDLDALRRDMAVMRPWVDFWTTRDYDADGLIVDTTEFMDHMIMMLTTNGVSTLAANAMYAGMLDGAAAIERELGDTVAADRYAALCRRTVDAINTVYWDEEQGYFCNMTLWGDVSRRSAQPAQSMLLKLGATDGVRARRTLDFLKRNNWNDAGSITILPRMNHVPLSNDQNVKIWPWWNLWEAEARFRFGDPDGAYRLLASAAATIRDEKYPGLMEETLDLDGTSCGGSAFPTAAGNLLDVVVQDLFGVGIVAPGWREVRVVPAVPAAWRDYACRIPVPDGVLEIVAEGGRITVRTTGGRIRRILTTPDVEVVGAEKGLWEEPRPAAADYAPVAKLPVPPLAAGGCAQFYDAGFHAEPIGFIAGRVDVEGLCRLAGSGIRHLVVPGNRLPLVTPSGRSVREALEAFTASGGNIILYGAEVNAKSDEDGAGILGEQCGLIDWMGWLPAREKVLLGGWRSAAVDRGRTTDFTYAASVLLPRHFEGRELFVEIGQTAGLDSLTVNGRCVATFRDMDPLMRQEYPTATDYPHNHKYKRVSRIYRFTPGDEAYAAFRFGAENRIGIRISGDPLREGLTDRNRLNIGVERADSCWQALDEDLPGIGLEFPKRKGVNYWGSERFFNSWSTGQGLFGFAIAGRGIRFADDTVLAGLPAADADVRTAYTDFALFAPLRFEVLAWTTTRTRLLYPMEEEHYPCIVRVVDSRSGGGYTVITPAVVGRALGEEIIGRLTGANTTEQ